MKKLILLFTLLSTTAMADIPTGRYLLTKIQCASGKVLKLGGKFMTYKITLDVNDASMKMTAVAHSAKWAPFKLNCTQVNVGKYSYRGATQYEGYLHLNSVTCNAKTWEKILRKQSFGVENQGVFNYTVSGKNITINNPSTITKYSCAKTNSYPIYHYTRQ